MMQVIAALCVVLVIVGVVFLGVRLWDKAEESAADHALAEAARIQAQTDLQREVDLHREQMYMLHAATMEGRQRDGLDIAIEILAGVGLLAVGAVAVFVLWRFTNPGGTIVIGGEGE